MKKVFCLILALMIMAIMTGCAKEPEEEPAVSPGSVVVGFSQLGAESSWRIANTASMVSAAESYGFALMMENANQKQELQIKSIRSFIASRVDVIVFSPIVETGWDNVLREAKQAGIPVILMDRMIETTDDSLYTAYVGADFYAEGRKAGEYLIKKANALGADHLNIVEISGTIDSTPMRDRQRGFMDVISGDTRFTVIDSISGDFLRSKGEECMTDLLARYGADGIDVIYSHNDSMTLGALDVMEQAGVKPGQDIIVISVDGEKEAVQALKDGRVNCIVQCTPALGGSVMSLIRGLVVNQRTIPRVTHPVEAVFSDFDDLTDPSVEGF
ncbi:MAG: ABC transporter substrate-binding protein [Clostridia bacterium]|nr:ABC transporter substrate-binding protein [Clostridia bacterium]